MAAFEIQTPAPPTSDEPAAPPSESDGYEAFRRIEPEIAALPEIEVRRVTGEIPRCVAIALGAMPALRVLRVDIVRELPNHPIDQLDKLPEYALASYYTHFMATPAGRTIAGLQSLLAEAAPLRERLLVGAGALAHVGVFDAEKIAEIRSGSGHLDTANDLVALSLVFRVAWPMVHDKTPVTQAECERADRLGRELVTAVGARMQPSAEPGSIDRHADHRARAFTLFTRAYESCRQAVSYLRWNRGDADLLVPSLFTRPRSRKASAPAETAPDANGANGSAASGPSEA